MKAIAVQGVDQCEFVGIDGDEVRVKILRIDVERKRISLSITKAKDAE